MFKFDHLPTPHLRTPLPGPVAAALLERDEKYVSPSYTRCYPLVVEEGSGCGDRGRGRQPLPRFHRRESR